MTMDSAVEASENVYCDDAQVPLEPQGISIVTMRSAVKDSENIRCDDGQWCSSLREYPL